MRFLPLAALLAAGLLAGAVPAHGQTIETTTTTVRETTTAPGTAVVTTATVPATPTSPTTTSSSSSSSTPTWAWVALAILGTAVVGLAVALLTRRGGDAVPTGERRRQLDNSVTTWAAQGWALQSQTTDSAVLQRGAERMVVSVDDAGNITTRPLTTP